MLKFASQSTSFNQGFFLLIIFHYSKRLNSFLKPVEYLEQPAHAKYLMKGKKMHSEPSREQTIPIAHQ